MVLRATKQSKKLPAQKRVVDSVIKPLESGFSEGLAKEVSLQSMKKQAEEIKQSERGPFFLLGPGRGRCPCGDVWNLEK